MANKYKVYVADPDSHLALSIDAISNKLTRSRDASLNHILEFSQIKKSNCPQWHTVKNFERALSCKMSSRHKLKVLLEETTLFRSESNTTFATNTEKTVKRENSKKMLFKCSTLPAKKVDELNSIFLVIR